MMSSRNLIRCLAVICGLLAIEGIASAGSYGYYTYSSRGYGYRKYTYYHQPSRSYHYHIAVYRTHQPRYVYYYNSQTRVYWGRYNLETGKYALLPNNKKTADLDSLTSADFLPEGKLPKEGEGSDDSLLPPPLPPAPAPRIVIPSNSGCHSR